jgi:hypothetical protein
LLLDAFGDNPKDAEIFRPSPKLEESSGDEVAPEPSTSKPLFDRTEDNRKEDSGGLYFFFFFELVICFEFFVMKKLLCNKIFVSFDFEFSILFYEL